MIDLNRKLGSVCVPHLIDETYIANLYAELASLYAPSQAFYWLLYARFTEAALLCAGNYADNCEYSAAGDLLVNPRRIQVYDEASADIKVKRRHKSISEQFKPEDMCAEDFRKYFSSNFKLRITEPALLPLLAGTLARSGLFSQCYLASINERMKRIADTISFLLSWSIDSQYQLQNQLASANPQSKKFIKSNLCRFDRSVFDALGAELFFIERNRLETSAFFKAGCNQNVPGICMQSEDAGISPVPTDERSLSDGNAPLTAHDAALAN